MWSNRWIPLFIIFILLSGCVPRPAPDRDSLIGVSQEQERAWGAAAYSEILKTEKISEDRQLIDIMERVGRQLAAVSSMSNLEWEFMLIDSKKMDAWILPGGKVIISTGILPVCANEAGLAVVMSHLFVHVQSRHGAERLSTSLNPNGEPSAISVSLSNHKEKHTILAALGAGSAVGITLPFSPEHEAEADEKGMILMAQAGYDPKEAGRFWMRFHKIKQGSPTPEFLSTHLINAQRMDNLRKSLPNANRLYQANRLKHGLGQSFLYILSRRQMKQKFPGTSPSPAQNPEQSEPIPGSR